MITVSFKSLTLLTMAIFGARWAIDDLRPNAVTMPEPPTYLPHEYSPFPPYDGIVPAQGSKTSDQTPPFAWLDAVLPSPK